MTIFNPTDNLVENPPPHTPQVIFPETAPTASAPTYEMGALYFDTTLHKLRVGGATGWETVTSS